MIVVRHQFGELKTQYVLNVKNIVILKKNPRISRGFFISKNPESALISIRDIVWQMPNNIRDYEPQMFLLFPMFPKFPKRCSTCSRSSRCTGYPRYCLAGAKQISPVGLLSQISSQILIYIWWNGNTFISLYRTK